MSRLTHLGGALALLLCFSSPLLADDTSNLGEVSVTATRTPLIADQEIAPVIVVGPEELALAQYRNIGDVLRDYAGLDLAQSGGPGQPESLFLRGTNSNQTLVMIDGVRINPDNGFGSALQNIRLNDVERIEIVKGPRASLYGSDAIGGVINIITKHPTEGAQYGAYTGAGRYGTYDTGGQAGYGHANSAFGISADDFHTDGFPAVAGATTDSGNTDRSWNGYGRTQLGLLDLTLNHWQSRGNTQYLDFSLNPVDEQYADATTGLDLRAHLPGGWLSTLKLSHMLDEIDQVQSTDFVHSHRNDVDWQNDLPLGDHQLLTAGLYTEAEDTAFLSGGLGQPENHRVNAVYAEDDLDLDSQRLVLAGRDTHDQEFGDHFTWNGDYGYDFDAATRLTAGVGTGFRAPSADELYDPFAGNPNLQPETSRNLELGLRRKFDAGAQAELSLFQDMLDDLIVFDPTAVSAQYPFGRNENVGHARVEGLELSYTLVRRSFSWRTDLILQNPEDLDSDSYLLRRARQSLTTSLVWHDDRSSAGLNLLLSGPRADVDYATGNPTTDGGYLLLGVSLRRALGAGFSVTGRIDNLLDKQYQTANGYNTAGRSLFISIAYASL